MNIWKYIKNLPLCFAVIATVSSCEDMMGDFLEKPQGSEVNEDTIFSTKKNIESLLFSCYQYGLHSYYPYSSQNGSNNPNPTSCMTAPITDEAEMSETWFSSQQWNIGAILKSNITSNEDSRWSRRFKAIRLCNILIERLPESTAVSDEEKKDMIGEALFIRALNNFEMFKRYGGMPIVDHRFAIDEDMKIPRASVADFVNFIVKDCDDAAQRLEGVTYPANQHGRITQSAALALKAKTLLYAASPLFNTATPYFSTDHPELVCYGNYDANRWKLAADAAEAALDACHNDGFEILNEGDPENDYRKIWEVPDNSEIILAENWASKIGNWSHPWATMVPTGFGMNTWGTAVCIPHNFIRKYEKMDGTKGTWDETGNRASGLMEKYAELDPRFRQTVAYNGSKWNDAFTDVQLYEGATGSPMPKCNVTGAILHKLIPTQLSGTGNNYQMAPSGILLRIGELYLDLAEALNEYESSPSRSVYDAINIIRQRADMPDLPQGLTKEQMRDRIKNERDVELAFEDHRMWDIRRWMDAEKDGVMQGKFCKVVIYRTSGSGLDQECDYSIVPFETRIFHRNMYLHPIPEGEFNKGYMFQNPGW